MDSAAREGEEGVNSDNAAIKDRHACTWVPVDDVNDAVEK